MTVATTTNSYTYNGNDLTTVFAFNSVFLDAADLTVILTSSAGVETVQTITTHYTVSGGSGSTGSVTMVTAPATGEKLTIVRDPALTQTLDLVANDPLPAEELEQALDKAVMLLQRVAERIDRSVVIQDSDTGTLTLPVAADRASKYAAFDSSGNLIASTGPTGASEIPVSSFIETLLDDTTAAAARTTLGAITGADSTTFSGTNSFSGANTVSGSLNVTGTLTAAAAPLPRSWLAGLGMSNGTDTAHDIDIAAGAARDSTDAADLRLAATLTKAVDVNWAEGNGGGFPSGLTLTADTWYRVFVIGKTDGTTDGGFDTSASAANLLSDATGYTLYRQIGWIRTYTGTGPDIRQFIQTGDKFIWTDPNAMGLDESDFALSTAEQTITLDFCPPSVEAIMNAGVNGTESAYAWIYETGVTSASVGETASMLPNVGSRNTSSGQANTHVAEVRVGVDASRQIHARGITTHTLDIQMTGWIDRRGRDD